MASRHFAGEQRMVGSKVVGEETRKSVKFKIAQKSEVVRSLVL